MVGAIIVSHENIAASMVEALTSITGESRGILPISSRTKSPAQLEGLIVSAIESMKGVDSIILFTDLHGGSCSHVCSRVQKKFPEVLLITGVNLPLLIDFIFNRDKPSQEIAERLVEKGKAGIKLHVPGGLGDDSG